MSDQGQPGPVLPGEWLGMVGGGQLGRMFCHAAQSMGYKVAVLDPDSNSPAGAVADQHLNASYDDVAALERLAQQCRAVTTEFENVPAASLEILAKTTLMRPQGAAVATVQDRIREKAFLVSAGAPVAPYLAVEQVQDLDAAADALFPGILKAARLGYDGKGQIRVQSRDEARAAFGELGNCPCVLEAMLPLAAEISVVMARGADGETTVYPAATNVHRSGILAVSSVNAINADEGADIAAASHAGAAAKAADAATKIAAALDYVGVLCVEFFVLQDGSLVANEIAPRPHNSGHYSMNASVTSQFEQQVRATAGLPLGDTTCLSSVVMLNLLGDLWFDNADKLRDPDWASVLAVPGVKLHLYGKAEARRGRKMGHVNVLGDTIEKARQNAVRVATILGLPASLDA